MLLEQLDSLYLNIIPIFILFYFILFMFIIYFVFVLFVLQCLYAFKFDLQYVTICCQRSSYIG